MSDPGVAGAMVLAAAALMCLPLPGPAYRGGARREQARENAWLRRIVLPALGVAAAAQLLGLPEWSVPAVAAAAGWFAYRSAHRVRPMSTSDLRAVAAVLDLFAACLDAGMPSATALAASLGDGEPAPQAPRADDDGPPAGRDGPAPNRGLAELGRTAALLRLGGEPAAAWRGVARLPELAALAAAARRSATGGLTLASAARETVAALRAAGVEGSGARATRAGVLMTAPLALCFLPAFLCLGLAPTVLGLIGSLHLW